MEVYLFPVYIIFLFHSVRLLVMTTSQNSDFMCIKINAFKWCWSNQQRHDRGRESEKKEGKIRKMCTWTLNKVTLKITHIFAWNVQQQIKYQQTTSTKLLTSFYTRFLWNAHKFCGPPPPPPYVYDSQYNSFNGDHCNNAVVYDEMCVCVCMRMFGWM